MEEVQKRVVGRPFPKGAAHPRYGGKGRTSVPKASDGKPLWQLFRTYTEEAAILLARVMNDKREDMELRVRAAAMILQRGWGDAPKHLMLTPLTDQSRANELTEADILSLVRARPSLTIEAPPSRGDEGGSLSGTGSSPPSEIQPDFPPPPVVIDVPVSPPEPVSIPLPVPDIPTFLTPPTPER